MPLSTQLSSLPAILGNSWLSLLSLITPITIPRQAFKKRRGSEMFLLFLFAFTIKTKSKIEMTNLSSISTVAPVDYVIQLRQ